MYRILRLGILLVVCLVAVSVGEARPPSAPTSLGLSSPDALIGQLFLQEGDIDTGTGEELRAAAPVHNVRLNELVASWLSSRIRSADHFAEIPGMAVLGLVPRVASPPMLDELEIGRQHAGSIEFPVAAGPTPIPDPEPTASPSRTPLPEIAGTPARVSSATLAPPKSTPSAQPLSPPEALLVAAMNEARATAGLSPLVPTADLTDVALARSEEMIRLEYFAHFDPNGHSAARLLEDAAITFSVFGENLIRTYRDVNHSVEVEFEALMDSPSHRGNVLKPAFTRVGVGSFTSDGGVTIITTIFTDR